MNEISLVAILAVLTYGLLLIRHHVKVNSAMLRALAITKSAEIRETEHWFTESEVDDLIEIFDYIEAATE